MSLPKDQEQIPIARKSRISRSPEQKLIKGPVISTGSKIHHFMNKLIDSGSLWFAVAIDLVLNGIGFWIIGPDPIMKVGMVCVSVIVVLFSVRAWIKRDRPLWMMLALVASFMDTSFVLLSTDVQTQNNSIDTELTRLTDIADKSQVYLSSLQGLQLEKGQGYAQQIKDAVKARDDASNALVNYRLEPRASGSVKMTASKVATAIPDAVMSGRWDRWILLSVFVTVFVGLQLTIISATGVHWNDRQSKDD